MMHTIEQRTLHSLGKVQVVVKRVYDDDADFSWLGKWSNFKEPRTPLEKLVDSRTLSVLDHHGIWRDNLGRIVPAPEVLRDRREYQFTFHDNGHDQISRALQDHKRLVDLNNGYWSFIGVVAKVVWEGVEVGHSALWGIESDSGEDYLRETERDCAREALRNAGAWMAARRKMA